MKREVAFIASFTSLISGYINAADVTGDRLNIGASHHLGATGSTVGGGRFNTNMSTYGVISGGQFNFISNLDASVIGGGSNNTNNGALAVISGGNLNTITTNARSSLVAGGEFNYNDHNWSALGGGIGNRIEHGPGYGMNVLAGGEYNTITSSGVAPDTGYANVVSGGAYNYSLGNFNTISGGAFNTNEGGYATISGGTENYIDENAEWAAINGGWKNWIEHGGEMAWIGGGRSNYIDSSGVIASLGGGGENYINGGAGTIAGGQLNRVHDAYGTISGGLSNVINPAIISYSYSAIGGGAHNSVGVKTFISTIAGGIGNTIGTNASWSSVLGGRHNKVLDNAVLGTIAGGDNNIVGGSSSFAAGQKANAKYNGCFIWADNSDLGLTNTAANQFMARSSGGVIFYTSANSLSGVSLAAGSGSWSSLSDRNAKENFKPVDGKRVLDAVTKLPISTWNYKTQSSAIRHMGPVAQDFAEAFEVGEENTRIATVDQAGVALAAIQGLNQLLEERDSEMKALRAELNELRNTLKANSR